MAASPQPPALENAPSWNVDRLALPSFPDGSRWTLVSSSTEAHAVGAASGTSPGFVYDMVEAQAAVIGRAHRQRFLALLDASGAPEGVLSLEATVRAWARLNAVVAPGGRDAGHLESRVSTLSSGAFILTAARPDAWTLNPNVDPASRRPLAQRTFEDFVGMTRDRSGVLVRRRAASAAPDEDESIVRALEAVTMEQAERYFRFFTPSDGMRILDFGMPGYTARVDLLGAGGMNSPVVIEDSSDRLVGGSFLGNDWVRPEFRGCGLGAEIALACDAAIHLRLGSPGSFSEAGLAARRRAYMTAVERHLERTPRILRDVLASYNRLRGDAGMRPLAASGDIARTPTAPGPAN